jgi:hypothetical protein
MVTLPQNRLGIENMRLIVPEGINVYQPINDVRLAGELLFLARSGKDTLPAYASLIRAAETAQGLNYLGNVGKILDYSWFSAEDTKFIFDRLQRLAGNAPIYARTPQNEKHPFK